MMNTPAILLLVFFLAILLVALWVLVIKPRQRVEEVVKD